jgi:tight adherence protein C
MSALSLSLLVWVATFIFLAGALLLILNRTRNQYKKTVTSLLNSYVPTIEEMSEDVAQFYKKNIIDAIGELLISQSYQKRIRIRLVATGKQDINAYRVLVRRKVVGTIIGFSYGLLTQLDAGLRGIFIILIASALGFFLPDVLTFNTGSKRSLELDRTLPDAIDILNLCVESGLTFQASMAQVSLILEGPISDEFARVLRQMQLGQSLIASLQDLSTRNNNNDLKRFVSVVIQADKLGVPISTVLQEQAREMRGKRRDRAREQAQKVPVKILGPVMLCFLPGIFIVILGPAMVSITRAFSGM